MTTNTKNTGTLNETVTKGSQVQKILGSNYRGFVSIDQEMEHVLLNWGKSTNSEFKDRHYGKGSL